MFWEGDAAEHRKARKTGHGACVHVCKGWEKKIMGACIPASAGQLGEEGVRHMSVQECWERGY